MGLDISQIPTCKTCCFFYDVMSACRRYPPRVLDEAHKTDITGIWPEVSKDDWCGEYVSWREA